MKILFLSIGRLKRIDEKGMYTDLLREFKNNNHSIYIVHPVERREGKETEYVKENGVHFLRVKTGNIKKTNLIEKGISTITLESVFLKSIKRYLKNIKFDLVLYTTPPITFGKVVKYIKHRDGARSYLLLKDIFPQNAVDIGMFSKKSLFYKFFRAKEIQLYKISDYIGCMSPANAKYLLRHNPWINKEIVGVCPNSIEPAEINITAEQKEKIRAKYGIPLDKTVFVYGGNLGKPQGIDFVIEALKSQKENDKVFFLIVGAGTEFNKLKSYFDTEGQANAKLLSELPKAEYEILANSCDVGLIFLDKRFTIPNFPSRLLPYMQASIPVLAATDVNTDVGAVIENGNFGLWCESGDADKFGSKLQQLLDEEIRKQMGSNARRYLENHYTTEHSYEIIMKHFSDKS
jgi:glycosyltransferase involved in cell wall biosynthesis